VADDDRHRGRRPRRTRDDAGFARGTPRKSARNDARRIAILTHVEELGLPRAVRILVVLGLVMRIALGQTSAALLRIHRPRLIVIVIRVITVLRRRTNARRPRSAVNRTRLLERKTTETVLQRTRN
jgi:hypothetical protein